MIEALAKIVGDNNVEARVRVTDASASRGISGEAAALVRPATAREVAHVVAWCYENEASIVPIGGATGFSGGAVPLQGDEVVISLERLTEIRAFEPNLWRINVEAGVRTADVARLARENGLFYPPDPGAAEQSQIGGNIATNAGGPHAFKYGVTGTWVTGVEAVVAPGTIVNFGGPFRKDVASYDMPALLAGSEGTLGIVTAAWLRLIPAPAASHVLAAFYAHPDDGCQALLRVFESGAQPAALEYLDAGALAIAGVTCPVPPPAGAGFMLIAEADGSPEEAAAQLAALREALSEQAMALVEVEDPRAMWRWRDGVSIAVTAIRGGKLSEDICVPVERLADAIGETVAIGKRRGLIGCSWGHAGDGNLHATFLLEPGDSVQATRAEACAEELFRVVVAFGGTISGEHGVGIVKREAAARQFKPAEQQMLRAVKAALDPKGLFNPGKKLT